MVGDDHDCRNGRARLEMLLEIVSQVIKVRPRGQSPSRHHHHCCHRVLSYSIQMDGWQQVEHKMRKSPKFAQMLTAPMTFSIACKNCEIHKEVPRTFLFSSFVRNLILAINSDLLEQEGMTWPNNYRVLVPPKTFIFFFLELVGSIKNTIIIWVVPQITL